MFTDSRWSYCRELVNGHKARARNKKRGALGEKLAKSNFGEASANSL